MVHGRMICSASVYVIDYEILKTTLVWRRRTSFLKNTITMNRATYLLVPAYNKTRSWRIGVGLRSLCARLLLRHGA